MAKRALGSDPLAAVLGESGPPRKAGAPKPTDKGPRAALNIVFGNTRDAWVWVDWVRAAQTVLTRAREQTIEQKDLIGEALERFKESLPKAQRQEIEAEAARVARIREKAQR